MQGSLENKFKERKRLKNTLTKLQRKGKKIVFTNGCFDLLHVGHIRYLAKAKSLGDILVVAINSDTSVKKIKGKGRPLIKAAQRAEVLAALGCVDFVTVFPEATPLETIELLKPDILVKGADWERHAIIGRQFVEDHGGKVVRLAYHQGYSTSQLIKKIIENFKDIHT